MRSFLVLALVSAVCLSVGCGGRKNHPRAEVSGKVTIGDKPLPGGMITFTREDDARDSCIVYILSDGTYSTTSAPVGKCKVSVRTSYLNPNPVLKQGEIKPHPPEHYVALSGNPKTGKAFVAIPKKYEDVNESGLIADVGSSSTTHNIKLDEK
jgi:hypothetical protein